MSVTATATPRPNTTTCPLAIHHRRQRRRRQEHADRPPAVRQQGRSCRPARPRVQRLPARHRPVAAHRRPRGRARTGHHHRRGLPLLRHARQRKFIIADAPGHEQYTRNMVTAAAAATPPWCWSTSPSSTWQQPPARHCCRRRAAMPCWRNLLRVPSIVFAVNKLDAVERAAGRLRRGAARRCSTSPRRPASRWPASCRSRRCAATTWPRRRRTGRGTAARRCCSCWKRCPSPQERTDGALLLPVQYVARDGDGDANQTARVLGPHRHGRVRAGRRACSCFPSGERAMVAEVRRAGDGGQRCRGGPVGRPRARPPARRLARRLDRARRRRRCRPQRFAATLAWLDTEPAVVGRKYWVRHGNRWVQARIATIESRLDIHTLADTDAHELAVNDIGHVVGARLQQPLPSSRYATTASAAR